MPRNTKGNREGQRRRTLPRGGTHGQQRRRRPPARFEIPTTPQRLNLTPLGQNRRVARPLTNLESTIRVGARRPTNANLMGAMKKGKVPKSVRALLLLAMSNPYTGQTKAAMNAASYLQKEINKQKTKKRSKSR